MRWRAAVGEPTEMRTPILRFLAVAAGLAAAALFPASVSHASDGVYEINQSCATSTGCFPGDAPGFPVTITTATQNGARFQLTSALVVADQNQTAIRIQATHVSIDLNGFVIMRQDCATSTATGSCPAVSGSGDGIAVLTVLGNEYPGISVRNGTILGMGRYGVLLENDAVVSDLRVRRSGSIGIQVGSGAIITRNIVAQNLGGGIAAINTTNVTDNVARENGFNGIFSGWNSVAAWNAATLNGYGVVTSVGSVAVGNSAYDNDTDGINVGAGSVVRSSAAMENGNGIIAGIGALVSDSASMNNLSMGIQVAGSGLAQRNVVNNNDGYSLDLGNDVHYRENNVVGSLTVNGGLNMFSNSCNGNTFCP